MKATQTLKALAAFFAAFALFVALSGCNETNDNQATDTDTETDSKAQPQKVSIGDTLEEVRAKAGREPSGELERNGVLHLVFDGSTIKLQNGYVVYVDPNFVEGEAVVQPRPSASITRSAPKVPRQQVISQVTNVYQRSESKASVSSSERPRNAYRNSYTVPGKITIVCGNGDKNFADRVKFLANGYLDVEFLYRGSGRTATVYDKQGYVVMPRTNDLDRIREGIRSASD